MKIRNILGLTLLISVFSCSDLNEELRDSMTREQAEAFLNNNTDVNTLLRGAYDGLRAPYMDQAQFWAAQQHTSDETIGPTRGGDWDDNGVWRVLHTHNWALDHSFLENTFNNLLQVVFTTTNILTFPVSPEQAAEARFIRAFVMFSLADGWNQVPFREPGGSLLEAPKVLSGSEAVTFVISELEAIMNNLPENNPTFYANKNAARALLAKCYLNKNTMADRTNPSFPAADMDKVISFADAVINSGKYSLSNNYFENFAPNNNSTSTENIWTGENRGGSSSGNVRSRWFMTLHYNNNPSGWNGFTTLSDFYDKFEANDTRRGGDFPGMTEVSGLKTGFLVGQQFDQNGVELLDRKGNKLAFTREVKAVETGNNLEVTGIRVVKYPIDYKNGDNADNDYVFLRYSDVLLMKAEALLRKGNSSEALNIVNQIRTKRGASSLSGLTAEQLLDERGRELYWEGWRRQDLIRFGSFLKAWQEKPASGNERLLFPIPPTNLAVNPNLTQNPGY